MADIRDLQGVTYAEDFPIIKEFLEDLANNLKVTDLEGEIITHTFTTTGAEAITHQLGRTPVNWVSLDKSVAATVYKSSAGTSSISLVSSSGSLVFKFYVE